MKKRTDLYELARQVLRQVAVDLKAADANTESAYEGSGAKTYWEKEADRLIAIQTAFLETKRIAKSYGKPEDDKDYFAKVLIEIIQMALTENS